MTVPLVQLNVIDGLVEMCLQHSRPLSPLQ